MFKEVDDVQGILDEQIGNHPRKPRASKGRETGRKLGARKMRKRRGEGQGREKRKGKLPFALFLPFPSPSFFSFFSLPFSFPPAPPR